MTQKVNDKLAPKDRKSKRNIYNTNKYRESAGWRHTSPRTTRNRHRPTLKSPPLSQFYHITYWFMVCDFQSK